MNTHFYLHKTLPAFFLITVLSPSTSWSESDRIDPGLISSLQAQIREHRGQPPANSETRALGSDARWALKPSEMACDVSKSLEADTLLEHPNFTMNAPKGWSAGHRQCPKSAMESKETVRVTPNASPEFANVFVNISRNVAKEGALPESVIFSLTADCVRKASIVTINKIQWLSCPAAATKGIQLHHYAAIKDSNLWMITVGTTDGKNGEYRKEINGILASVKIK